MFDPNELTHKQLIQVAYNYLELAKEVKFLREKNIEYSWKLNPDTSGGAFTDQEAKDRKLGYY